MLQNILKIFYLLLILVFVTFSVLTYFSDDHISKIYKNRSLNSNDQSEALVNLPLIKSDTENVILYEIDDTDLGENIKKRKIWELLKKDNE
mgnify:CR=1 FL=1|tara:strand:- start:1679 stop:1951 length:273 start_codon:yes stop_codon:yes gene_type:complete